MTTNMITAARLLAHKTINGKYQSLLQLDGFPVVGHQMVCQSSHGVRAMLTHDQQSHSIDSFITDSANSASALYSGHKSTVNAMGYNCNPKYLNGPMLTLPPAYMPTRHQMLSMTPKLRLLSSSWCASG